MKTSSISMWYSPVPDEISSARISLDFGLRAADLFFRELVVPELGGLWFVRQFSWPLAALMLYKKHFSRRGGIVQKPTAICHGIESLACKLEFTSEREKPSSRILGSRAFSRDAKEVVWSYRQLRQPSHYVQNTHRQAVTKPIRRDGGLGFASGSRFDLLTLEPVGNALATGFLRQRVGQGGTSLENWLVSWIHGECAPSGKSWTQRKALSPETPTTAECEMVRARVLGTTTAASEKRKHLADALGSSAELPDIEDVVVPRLRSADHELQADEVIAARAFGAVLDRARDVAARLTNEVDHCRRGIPVKQFVQYVEVKSALNALKDAARIFTEKATVARITERTSRDFADVVVGESAGALLRMLVRRIGEVLELNDDSVIPGALFRVIDSTDSTEGREGESTGVEPDRTGRTFRFANLHALLADVRRGGAS